MRQIWLVLAFMPIIWSSCVGVESEWTRHHTNSEVKEILDNVHDKCPDRTRVYSLPDKTVNGSKLWVIEFSTNPGMHEKGKPEFKYIGNMHGNEVVGKEILLRLVVFLCDVIKDVTEVPEASTRFNSEQIKTLLDNTRIHIMPSMNPDGWAIANAADQTKESAWLAGRANGNGVDLNRNFPDLDKKYYMTENIPNHHNNHLERLNNMLNNKSLNLQPETKMVMTWIFSLPWVLSANMHGGDLVANYPLDEEVPGQQQNTISKTPDHNLFRELATSYAEPHKKMAKQHKSCDPSEKFPGGITNGAQWYSVPGGMQDFNYFSSNCYEITLELGCDKFPPGDKLPEFWDDNFDAMINYMFQSHIGIKGNIKVPEEFKAIPVVIEVSKYDEDTNTETKVDHDILSTKYGDYFRLLSDGTYTVKANLAVRRDVYTIAKCVIVKNDPSFEAQQLDFDFTISNGGETCVQKGQREMQYNYEDDEYRLLQRWLARMEKKPRY